MSDIKSSKELHEELQREVELKRLNPVTVQEMLLRGGLPGFRIHLQPELETANLIVGCIVVAEEREKGPHKRRA